MEVPSTWLRPAIVWDPSLGPSKEGSCYWKPQTWHCENSTKAGNSCLGESPQLSTVSYHGLFSTAMWVVATMRQTVADCISANGEEVDQPTTQRVSVAVAIPEGPLLPLAVLVVHALNRPWQSTTDQIPIHVSLVPIEPSEAKERNRHILEDVRPSIVLTVPGQDMNVLEELVDGCEDNTGMSHKTHLLDFASIVDEAMESKRNRCDISDNDVLDHCGLTLASKIQNVVASGADYIANRGNLGTQANLTDAIQTAPRVSHIVYTSGTTGRPKGCVSSIASLQQYIDVKNDAHYIDDTATVLLASALSFDPCLSDILATFQARATLAVAPRRTLLGSLSTLLSRLSVSHVLCTPTLWSMVEQGPSESADLWKSLRVVALGGEPIPHLVRQQWARTSASEQQTEGTCRLFATYGVTEACVYQTCGEVFASDPSIPGQHVGTPFPGLGIRICQEDRQESLVDVQPSEPGEVVIWGAQLDDMAGYWKRPELNYKFVAEKDAGDVVRYHYRTGDRGVVDPVDSSLRILGRIVGEEGMVKVNGVRVELGEIESAVVGDTTMGTTLSTIIASCLAKVIRGGTASSEIHAYCVLSEEALGDLGYQKHDIPTSGFLLAGGGALLTLLRARCLQQVKAACMPTAFVILPSLPLSPTGKRDRSGLPDLDNCTILNEDEENGGVPLQDYGVAGVLLVEAIMECLNLQPSLRVLLTSGVKFSMLGGDSLAATRVVRFLYADHHQVENTRHLGGEYGIFDGPFDVLHLIRANSLGDYIDMLDRHGVGCRVPREQSTTAPEDAVRRVYNEAPSSDEADDSIDNGPAQNLYQALLQAVSHRQQSLADALLHIGADPNFGSSMGRLGKNKGGLIKRKAVFRSTPLHLACLKGQDGLVQHLLEKGANYKSPDVSGIYPVHLAASGLEGEESYPGEDTRRLNCVVYLLDAGTHLAMRDANKQTILHAASRAGHCSILEHVMARWLESTQHQAVGVDHFFNWTDRWYRTPLHWAVLNGRVSAVETLLKMGSSPSPPRRKKNKRSSAAVETVSELVERLYLTSDDAAGKEKGEQIQALLESATKLTYGKQGISPQNLNCSMDWSIQRAQR